MVRKITAVVMAVLMCAANVYACSDSDNRVYSKDRKKISKGGSGNFVSAKDAFGKMVRNTTGGFQGAVNTEVIKEYTQKVQDASATFMAALSDPDATAESMAGAKTTFHEQLHKFREELIAGLGLGKQQFSSSLLQPMAGSAGIDKSSSFPGFDKGSLDRSSSYPVFDMVSLHRSSEKLAEAYSFPSESAVAKRGTKTDINVTISEAAEGDGNVASAKVVARGDKVFGIVRLSQAKTAQDGTHPALFAGRSRIVKFTDIAAEDIQSVALDYVDGKLQFKVTKTDGTVATFDVPERKEIPFPAPFSLSGGLKGVVSKIIASLEALIERLSSWIGRLTDQEPADPQIDDTVPAIIGGTPESCGYSWDADRLGWVRTWDDSSFIPSGQKPEWEQYIP